MASRGPSPSRSVAGSRFESPSGASVDESDLPTSSDDEVHGAPTAQTTMRHRNNKSKSKLSPTSSQDSSPVRDLPIEVKPRTACQRALFLAWKVLQTLICMVSFVFCGVCGGCCIPCKSSRPSSRSHSRAKQHRRRRRKSVSALAEDAKPNNYEDWTEEDDDLYEYEVELPKHRHCASVGCKVVLLFITLFFTYSLFFVRVVPTPSGHIGGEFEVEFGFNNYIPPIGVPIPEQLHSTLHTLMGETSRPGLIAREDGLRAHFPVVFIPGIVSTGLEVWEGEKCAQTHFRQRLWGSTLMIRSILLDSRCWLRHLTLDGWTGLDPEGIKLRPASGLEAADYLVGGFWIWAKLIENFADVGYDVNSMFMAAYDWRLSFKHMQLRDYYFTKLKYTIEIAKLANHNRKVVMIAHSMGGNVIQYFLKWVESSTGGGGGPSWVSDHVESWVNIGTPWLGLPKVFSAIFSGEMKDTAELAPWMDYWRQKVVVSQADVLNIMRTFRSLPSMFPRGGNIVWGDSEGAPDDAVEGEDQLDELIPTKDYPGGEGQRFMTSQATAALRDDKYDDPNRISEAKERESHANEPLPNARDEVADPTGVTRSPHSYLGQFVSFTDDVPWPFPNITQIVDDAMKEIAQAEKEEGERPATEVGGRRRPSKTSKAWTKKLRQSVLKNGSTSALRELNIEDSIVLLKQLAWSDMEFNEELYTYGFGAKDERMTAHPANATTPIDLIDIDPASPDNVLDEAVRWVNPLETALPMAPHMKIYCMYGVGRESERGYVYANAASIPSMSKIADLLVTQPEKDKRMAGSAPDVPSEPGEGVTADGVQGAEEGAEESLHANRPSGEDNPPTGEKRIGARAPTIPFFALNTSYHHSAARIRSGVKLTDGDGTVPLVSLGYMCIDGWKQRRWNPAGLSVITREYRDLNESLAILRSATSVDHVDIMGNSEMITDVLYIISIRTMKASTAPNRTDVPEKRNDKREGAKSDLDVHAEVQQEALERAIDAKDALLDKVRGIGESAEGSATPKEDATEAKDGATSASTSGERLPADVAQERQADSEDAAQRASGSTHPTKRDATEEQATWKAGDEEARFAGQGVPARVDARADDLQGGNAHRTAHHPVGELTWTEVGERVYSRIRPISARVHARWERRTGHKLVEADKPPPLNRHQHYPMTEDEHRPTTKNSDSGPDSQHTQPPKMDLTKDGAAQPAASVSQINFDWTAEDEAKLHELVQRKRQMDAQLRAPDPEHGRADDSQPAGQEHAAHLGVSALEQTKCEEEEAMERELEQEAEQRSAQQLQQEQLRRAQEEKDQQQ